MEVVLFLFKKRIATNQQLNIGSLKEYSKGIEALISYNRPSFVCFTPTYLLGKALKNEELSNAINNADIVIPKGKFLLRHLGVKQSLKIHQTSPSSLANSLIQSLGENKICIVHEREGLNISNLISSYPNIKTIEFNPDHQVMIKLINKEDKSLVLVSLSETEQLLWMNEVKGKIKASMLGIGKTSTPLLSRLQYSLYFLIKLWF